MCTNFLAVHAGAGKHVHRTENVCMEAVRKSKGNIIEALKILENDCRTNCGFGSNLTFKGNVECEAAYTSSEGPIFGAVGAVSMLRNPIEVAAMVAKEQIKNTEKEFVVPAVLVGRGAENWAQQHGIKLCNPSSLVAKISREQWQKAHQIIGNWRSDTMDTVGAVSYKSDGSCDAACSSGGIILKAEGRLGHTIQIGGAVWADQKDSKCVAVALSGCGEYVARTLLAKNLGEALLDQINEDEVVIGKIRNIFTTKFLNSSYLRGINKKHVLAGGLVLLVDQANKSSELVSFHNTEELTFAFGGNGIEKKYRSRLTSDAFVAHSFSLRDHIIFH